MARSIISEDPLQRETLIVWACLTYQSRPFDKDYRPDTTDAYCYYCCCYQPPLVTIRGRIITPTIIPPPSVLQLLLFSTTSMMPLGFACRVWEQGLSFASTVLPDCEDKSKLNAQNADQWKHLSLGMKLKA